MSQDIEGIKRKIRSLLELAKPGSGATEPERDNARSLAAKLMAQHGLTEADIPERQIARPQPMRAAPPPPPVPVFRVYVQFDCGGATNNQSGGGWTTFIP